MKNKKLSLIIIIIALLIKFSLFTFASIHNPQAKFQSDSYGYLNTGMMLALHGAFAQDNNGVLKYELFRTPGYPLFLGLLHGILKIPLDGVILVQVLLTILAAFVTYKVAFEIDHKIAFLGAAIVLFSLPITIFSLMLLTESLYLLLISLFMLAFIHYLKNRETKLILLSAILLAAATYVRPISYYLGGALAAFIVYVNVPDKLKKAILHATLFLAVTYGLLGIWQLRNYIHFHQNTFASIIQENCKVSGIFHSYSTNKDPLTQGWPPIPYYVNVTWRCFLSLMTRPGSFKYLHFPILTIAGKVIGYPWVVFWMTGFLIGLTKIRRNIYYQFILCVILYFVFTTIGGEMWYSGERYRVPIMPFIAIISAAGWANRMA
jgi:4-amino-4-deoxy-L-arabinose transferase-like glycosyltransferase